MVYTSTTRVANVQARPIPFCCEVLLLIVAGIERATRTVAIVQDRSELGDRETLADPLTGMLRTGARQLIEMAVELEEVYGETRQQRCWMHKTMKGYAGNRKGIPPHDGYPGRSENS